MVKIKKKYISMLVLVFLIGIGIYVNNDNLSSSYKSTSKQDSIVNDYLIRASSQYKFNDFDSKFNESNNTLNLTSDKLAQCTLQFSFDSSNNSVTGLVVSYDKNNYDKEDHYKCIEYGTAMTVNTTMLKNQTLTTEFYNKMKEINWNGKINYEGYELNISEYTVSIKKIV
ncbi:hypothetical protein [Mycoplasma sp. P36-A1]|uniref:hypothetical protein n=1 Tax=Mycoplasma sp. P36-A1 TaxID=3252900 RepID=UPI003C2BCF0E